MDRTETRRATDLPPKGQWTSLFNGKDLTGWTPKIKGSALGENYLDTFRVEDGVIKVCYDRYKKFNGEFGHLFYKHPFSTYKLRVEYRFVGDQVPGGPGWAFRNSGAMIHCQPPESMGKDQEFPVSIEVQFLGGSGRGKRPTGNVCTPGTHIVMDGKLITQHCNESKSKTYDGDQWVTVEAEVHGNGIDQALRQRRAGHRVREAAARRPATPTPRSCMPSGNGERMLTEATSRSRPRAIRSSSARSRSCRWMSEQACRSVTPAA